MNNIGEIASKIRDTDKLTLVGHAFPDGDCVGSLLGLYLGLKVLGKEPEMLLYNQVPLMYSFLSGVEHIKSPEILKLPVETVVFLDCSDLSRVGEEMLSLLAGRSYTINIDHHLTNDIFGDLNYVDPQAAATGEIVFDLLQALQVDITPSIAEALYTALVMDSGSFLYGNTTGKTMRTAAALLDSGVDVNKVRVNLMESKPRQEIMLLQKALNHIGFSPDGSIAWMSLPYDEVQKIGAGDYHPEEIINYTRMIKGVKVGVLFREISPGAIKVGFRSKGDIDVADIARQFGGGGHRQAAGTRMAGTLDEVRNNILNRIEEVI